MKSLLASTVLLIGISGTAVGGECDIVLEKMRTILDEKGRATVAAIPKLLEELPRSKKVSIAEDEHGDKLAQNKKTIDIKRDGIARCFKLSGEWSQDPHSLVQFFEAGRNKFPRINAYIFFTTKQVKKIKNELTVVSTLPDEGNNRYIALTAESKEDEYGIVAGASSIQEIKKNIVWLNGVSGKQDLVEVVLCEGSCKNIHSLYTENRDASLEFIYPEGLDEQTETTKEQLEDARRKIEEKIETQLRKEFKSKSRKIGKEAIINFMASKTVFKFVNERGSRLGRKDLRAQECTPPKVGEKLTKNDLSTFFYKNCVSISGYKILNVKPTIQSGTPIITFKLKKTKPNKIIKIEVPVEMFDGSEVTTACTLQAMMVGSIKDDIVFIGTFSSNSLKPVLSLKLDNPIAWRGKTLVLKKAELEGVDCKPEDDELHVTLTPEVITHNGVLRLQKTTLHSTLDKALLVLNTMIGESSVNGSDSTTQFYPIADDDLSRELLTVMVAQSLEKLRGKVNGLTVALSRQDGPMKFIDYSDDFKKMKPDHLANIIVNGVRFVQGNFVWSTMLNTVKREVKNLSDYTYQLFIGQSGLSNKTHYCENSHSTWQQLKQEPVTFIYDFASDNNIYGPSLKDLEPADQKFPSLNCPVSNNIAVHVVLFPQSKKPGWDKNISRLFSNAFKDR